MNVRDRFFSRIYDKVKEGYDIDIVSADLGAPSLDDFRRDFPQRFVNVGIAEQNSIAVAGGLAMAGKTAISYGLNPFPVTRAFDQIRNIMSSLQIPVTVAALKAGSCTAEAGFSHVAIETISLLRTLKNVQILIPSDESLAEAMADEIVSSHKPRFIQFDPYLQGELYEKTDIDLERGFTVSGNGAVAVVTYGYFAHEIIKDKLPAKLIDCYSLPLSVEDFIKEVRSCKRIVTIEDGVESGGLGSMVLEILNNNQISIPVRRMALRFNDGYPHVHSDREAILSKEGITIEDLKKEISES